MKVAIVGYGNVGKALKTIVERDTGMQLVGVFSRRKLSLPDYLPFDELPNYRGKIDTLLLALGSYGDVVENAQNFAGFDTIDCFDNHAKISAYKCLMGKLNSKNLSIVATGWDPGILSVVRALFHFGTPPTTIWGEGISQGHSNALRTIPQVIDGVQFTLPVKNATDLAKNGQRDGQKLHKRVCYVACVEGAKGDVEREIKSMPYYFDGYDTQVVFCTPQEVRKLKQKTAHAGRVVASGDGFHCEARVSMQNNALFTAKIMTRYAKILPKLKADGYLGAVDVLDIPPRYLTENNVL